MKHCGLAWIEGNDPIVSYIVAFYDDSVVMGLVLEISKTQLELRVEVTNLQGSCSYRGYIMITEVI
jgi:hypothetical protein